MAGASLFFDIFARDKGIGKVLGEVGKKAGGLGPIFEGAGALVGKLAAPLLAIGAGVGIKKFADESVKSFEALAGGVNGLKRVMGGTVESVSAMRGAMQLSGIDVDAVGTTMGIFSKKLGAAAADGKSTSAMVEKLGMDFKDAEGNVKPLGEILPGLSDKFKSMPDGAEKTALAMELFGKQGAAMLPFLNKGSSAIGELEAKAKSMGLVIDDTSVKIMGAGKASAREFAMNIQGMKVQLGQNLAPLMTATSNVTRAALTPIIQGITGFFTTAQEPMMALAGHVQNFADKVGGTVSGLLGKLSSVTGQLRTGLTLPKVDASAAGAPLEGLVLVGYKVHQAFAEVSGGVRAFFSAFKAGGDEVTTSGFAGVLEQAGLFARHLWDSLSPLLPTLGGLYMSLSPVHLILSAIMPVLPQLAAAFGQVAMVLGGSLQQILVALIPVIGSVVGAASSLLPAIFSLVPIILQLVASVIPPLLDLFTQLVPVILQIVTVAIVPLVQMLGQVLPPIVAILVQLIASLVPVFMTIVQAVLSVVVALLPLISVILQLVGAVLPPLVQVLGFLITIIAAVITYALVPLVQFLATTLVAAVNGLTPVIRVVFTFIQNTIANAMTVIRGIINVVMGLIHGNWSQVWTGIQQIAGGVFAQVKNIVSSAAGVIQSTISGMLGFVGGIPGRIGDAFAGAGQWLVQAGANVVQGLMDGVRSMASGIGSFFLNLLPGWIVKPFKIALGINSPSRVFKALGRHLPEGLIEGVSSMGSEVDRAMGDLVRVPEMPGAGFGRGNYGGSGFGGGDSEKMDELLTLLKTQRPIQVSAAPGMSEEMVGRSAAEQLIWKAK
ncbi:hypothetical protein MB46_10410 [Arthrobacter alpinus]|uniref:phage tail tape measure protein n=1 Tax=Arthrobacter alpinus TaxID=656366 RepID=UPI0005C8F80D|nr:phage tail tape measure protein [Arthrobacter alpinus]ALV45833.1 hypothetical protein MB46_10410 [Arthrobacter alpinus]